jgi:RNA 3'-terminal phosphate cyclase (ATP)
VSRAVVVEIDGTHGEGGGSVVRTALAMSSLTGQAVAIRNVRGGLRKPGVNSVDCAIATILGLATSAEISAGLGDDVILFAPRKQLSPYRDRIDLNQLAKGSQPGSAPLILQSVLAPLARAGGVSRVSCRGGTHVPFAPTYDYIRMVTLQAMTQLGIYAAASIESAGYSHRGGGEVSLEIEPSQLNGFDFTKRGEMISLRAAVVISELPEVVGLRGVKRIEENAKRQGLEIKCDMIKLRSSTPGAAVTIAAEFEAGYGGSQSLGERGKPMEEVADEALFELIEWLNSEAGTDEFLSDQILLPAVMSREPCSFTTSRITATLTTTAWVIKQFMPAKITIIGKEGEAGEVTISP